MEIIRELCSFEGRLAGTDAERRAADRAAERLRELGRKAEVEPTYVHPQYGLVHALHCALGFAGSLIAIEIPALGFGLVLAAATSMYLDLNYRLYLVRSLFFRRASQNVVSRGGRADARGRLIVCAHVDTGRSGAVYAPKRARRAARLRKRFPWLGPFRLLFWSLAALLPLLGARMAGVDSDAIAVLQLPPTLVLLLGIFALVEIELSPVVPGANDNASGVATAISIAQELEADPAENLDVWLVLDGGEEGQQEGMRAFVRAHRKQLDRERTFFLSLESVGAGHVRYETAGGWVISYEMDRRLVALCEAIAAADAEGERRFGTEPLRHGSAGDSMPPRLAGFRSIGLGCLDEDGLAPHSHLPSDVPKAIDPQALDRAHDFALELIRQLDRDLGRRRVAAAMR
ncbi:MAG: M28 family peptidase, partial [Solirubrobacterales bacterium]